MSVEINKDSELFEYIADGLFEELNNASYSGYNRDNTPINSMKLYSDGTVEINYDTIDKFFNGKNIKLRLLRWGRIERIEDSVFR